MPKSNWLEQKQAAIPWVLCLALLVLYLTFPTKNYYWDGISFAQTIEDARQLGTSLVHPNHLIYNVGGYLFYRLLRFAGMDLRAITALQILNSLLSVITAGVFFFILKSTLRSLYLASFLTLLFALSATWWKFSTDADAYIASVLFLLISFYLILPDRKPRPLLVAMTFFVSMCFHQLAILFGPVVVLGLILQSGVAGRSSKVMAVVKFGLLSFALTTAAYYSCFYLASGKVDLITFLHWITSYSPDASFTFNPWDDLRYTLRGHARLFLNGRFNLIKGLINPFIAVLMFLLVAAFCFLTYLVVKHRKKPSVQWVRLLLQDPQKRPLFLLTATWLMVYLVFLFFWLPQNTFYRLFYLPALILLAGLMATSRYRDSDYQPKYRLAVFVVAVAIANFLFLIFPYSHTHKYPPVRFALEMNQGWPAGTVVYYGLANSDESLVR